MNIYFACSITGGREFESTYQEIVAALLERRSDVGDRAFAKLPQRLHDAELGRSHLWTGFGHGYDDSRSITTTVVARATPLRAGSYRRTRRTIPRAAKITRSAGSSGKRAIPASG